MFTELNGEFMKKILVKILSCALCLCLLASVLAGCNPVAKWDATKMNNWGSVVSTGGFLAETDNYIYYLNGVADTKADNTYGKAVKGSLMVADKNDLSKTEIAVPKLFGASDFNAGLYIFGDYVYYGTPSTDKASDGTVANSEMMFRRAKLDGSTDELLLTVNSLSVEYRIAEKNGTVYIVYYDTESSSIISFNANTKAKTVIAKTDEKTDSNESMASYVFLENEQLNSAVVVYTANVYSLPYNEDMATGTEAGRPTESYNKVYTYSVGDEAGKVVYNGESKQDTFEIVNNDGKFVYVKKTEEFGKTTVYALTANELVNKNATEDAGVEVFAEYGLSNSNLVVDIDTVYILPVTTDQNGQTTPTTGTVKIYKDTLRAKIDGKVVDRSETKQVVAICENVQSFITVYNDYLYYYNADAEIVRVQLNNQDANLERVSNGTVPSAGLWFAPEFIKIGAKDYMFYLDNSATGLSYITYIDLATVATGEDTDEDEKDDNFFLEGGKIIGKMLDSDKVKLVQVELDALKDEFENGNIVFDKDENGKYVVENGKLKVTAIAKARAVYEALDNGLKEDVNTSNLENYERAIEIASLLYKLEGVKEINKQSEGTAEYNAVKQIYNEIKPTIEEYYNSGEYVTINAFIENNLKANYSKAQTLFEPAETNK